MTSARLRPRPIDPPVSRFRLEVRRSGIQGRGVFAREPIPRRRLVIEYAGERITMKEARRRHRERGCPERVCFARLNRYWFIDAWRGNGAEFVNHSCDPNLYATIQRGHIFYYSRNRISRGEELTVDYKVTSEVGRIPCHCGSANCRGEMNRPTRMGRLRGKRRS
jgi:uncharacterized protein